jgi:hypothetical protein
MNLVPNRASLLFAILLLSTPSLAPAQTAPTCDPDAVLPSASAPLRRDVLGGALRSCGYTVSVSAEQQCENIAAPPCHVDPSATQTVFEVRWTHADATVSLVGPTPYWARWPSVRASSRGPYRIFEVTQTSEHSGASRTTAYKVVFEGRIVFDELLQECSNSGARWDCGPRARITWINDHTLQRRTAEGTRTVDLRAPTARPRT